MIKIIIEPRRTYNLKQAVVDAIESGDYDSLNDDILDCFMDDQVEEIEQVLETGDLAESIDDVISEWGGDDVEELFEAIQAYFEEMSVKIEFDQDDGLLDEDEEFESYGDDDEPDIDESFVDSDDDEADEGEDEDDL